MIHKKQIIIILFISLILPCSCSQTAITDIGIVQDQYIYDQSYEIDWEDIKKSEGYQIQISNVEEFSDLAVSKIEDESETSFGIARGNAVRIKLTEGDYYIRIKPLINGKERAPWSEAVFFHFTPVKLDLIRTIPKENLKQDQPFSFFYTVDTEGPGSSRIQISENNDFQSTVFNQIVENGIGLTVEIPPLAAGRYFSRIVFSSEDGKTHFYSDTEEILTEDPILWVHPDEYGQNTVEKIFSSDGTVEALNEISGMTVIDKAYMDSKEIILGRIGSDARLYFETDSELLRPIDLDGMPVGEWNTISAGESGIYLAGSIETGNGPRIGILHLHKAGTLIAEITLDTIVEWNDVAAVEEVVTDIFQDEDSLNLAGNSRSTDGQTAVWIAETDLEGNILEKHQYIGDRNIGLLDFLGSTESRVFYLGETTDADGKSPLLFYYYRNNDSSIRRIRLAAEKTFQSGGGFWAQSDDFLVLGWGPYLYKYRLNLGVDKMEPCATETIFFMARDRSEGVVSNDSNIPNISCVEKCKDDDFYIISGELACEGVTGLWICKFDPYSPKNNPNNQLRWYKISTPGKEMSYRNDFPVTREELERLIEYKRDIRHVNTLSITDMSELFNYYEHFNQDISWWDVSNVTDMSGMFRGVNTINQDITRWDVSNVTDMSGMFWSAHAFNQDISCWDVSNVTDMSLMFCNARKFNQDISGWNVSNVTTMVRMFAEAYAFRQDLSIWGEEERIIQRIPHEGFSEGANLFRKDYHPYPYWKE